MLDEFQAATGEPPSFFHLNDSEGALGSNKDRHVLIGEGKIGRQPFEWLLRDTRTAGIPLILETPEQNYDVADDDASADPYDHGHDRASRRFRRGLSRSGSYPRTARLSQIRLPSGQAARGLSVQSKVEMSTGAPG